jgi:hypothetical protein
VEERKEKELWAAGCTFLCVTLEGLTEKVMFATRPGGGQGTSKHSFQEGSVPGRPAKRNYLRVYSSQSQIRAFIWM